MSYMSGFPFPRYHNLTSPVSLFIKNKFRVAPQLCKSWFSTGLAFLCLEIGRNIWDVSLITPHKFKNFINCIQTSILKIQHFQLCISKPDSVSFCCYVKNCSHWPVNIGDISDIWRTLATCSDLQNLQIKVVGVIKSSYSLCPKFPSRNFTGRSLIRAKLFFPLR